MQRLLEGNWFCKSKQRGQAGRLIGLCRWSARRGSREPWRKSAEEVRALHRQGVAAGTSINNGERRRTNSLRQHAAQGRRRNLKTAGRQRRKSSRGGGCREGCRQHRQGLLTRSGSCSPFPRNVQQLKKEIPRLCCQRGCPRGARKVRGPGCSGSCSPDLHKQGVLLQGQDRQSRQRRKRQAQSHVAGQGSGREA